MIEADGIIIGSPTYFSNISTEAKALIDRAGLVSRINGDLLKRKVGAAVIAARRGGAVPAFSAVNYFFLIGQMIVPGSTYWNLGYGLVRHIGTSAMAWSQARLKKTRRASRP
jgi:multimeric flavodoxin WrbA